MIEGQTGVPRFYSPCLLILYHAEELTLPLGDQIGGLSEPERHRHASKREDVLI